MLLFSTYKEQGLLSSCSARASHCGGFSCRGARALGHTGFRGFSGCSSWALEHRLSSGTRAYGVFLEQALNPCLLRWLVGSLPLSHQGSHGSATFYLKSQLQSVSGSCSVNHVGKDSKTLLLDLMKKSTVID